MYNNIIIMKYKKNTKFVRKYTKPTIHIQIKIKSKSDWIEINDDSHRTYNTNSWIKLKITMLKSSLRDYSDTCTLPKRIISVDFPGNNVSFKFKQKIAGQTGDGSTKNVEIMVSLKYFNNFLEMPLINCEINLVLTWSANCVLLSSNANQATTFAVFDTWSVCNFIDSR